MSLGQKCIRSLIRLLVPPHADNEEAAEYLRTSIGEHHSFIEWTAVRPGTLTNKAEPTKVSIHPSPTRSAIFDHGDTSRINVTRFMADLVSDSDTWIKWKGQMPVIYNSKLDPV